MLLQFEVIGKDGVFAPSDELENAKELFDTLMGAARCRSAAAGPVYQALGGSSGRRNLRSGDRKKTRGILKPKQMAIRLAAMIWRS